MRTNKIHVTFPPGCYGSYVMQCIHAYSNLSSDYKLVIDKTGSSHTFRNKLRRKNFRFDHDMLAGDIIIGTAPGHALDYFVAMYVKVEMDIDSYIERIWSNYKTKLNLHWNNEEDWSTREWISCWLTDLLDSCYASNTTADITTDKLFDKDEDVFPAEIKRLINKLELSVDADIDDIKMNHATWQKAQEYHNLQKRCDDWVNKLITTREDTTSPCVTILDEAYVQDRLRKHGYLIRCYGLNKFPTTSNELRELLYKESEDDDTT